MEISPRDRLKELLSNIGANTSDSASATLPADMLELHVESVGSIPLPISSASAAQLISVARPAHFGKGEETLHDPSIRDTWELSPDQVELSGNIWDDELAKALTQLGAGLGFTETAKLRTELHSMLIYGTGQFFAPHQDSEKHDDMVATLVVSLPSAHTGGELVVDDRGVSKQYAGFSDELGLVMFYADRRHEVLPVRAGHRVTLTFNVLMESEHISVPAEFVKQAHSLFREHFTTPAVSSYGRELGVPNRLAFLLDHEYSQHGLRMDRLKGVDAQRVAILTAAAKESGYEYALALSEIAETWDVNAAMDFDDYDLDGFDDFDESGGELNALIDSSIVLTWWTDLQSEGAIDLALEGESEVCAVTPTVALQPYEADFEGYMGNYGNTEDRWYRRAALLLWPKEKAFTIRAEASMDWALDSILHALETHQQQLANRQVETLLSTGFTPLAPVMPMVLKIIAGINQIALAQALLKPFAFEALTANNADALAQVAHLYPPSFWNEVFEQWSRNFSPVFGNRVQWIETTLQPLCTELRRANAEKFADRIVTQMRERVFAMIRYWLEQRNPMSRHDGLSDLGAATAALLFSANDHHADNVVGELQQLGSGVLPLLLATLRSGTSPANSPFDKIASIAREHLTELLAQPQRAADDWSIAWLSPGGEDADRLEQFLNAADEHVLEWPLAKPRRQQIHRMIDQADLPVIHTTRRKGSPHVLILTKTKELFLREADTRRQAEQDLAWITAKF